MKIYQVGGAVRDALLGLPVHDRDWVVVDAAPQELIALGYLPVRIRITQPNGDVLDQRLAAVEAP